MIKTVIMAGAALFVSLHQQAEAAPARQKIAGFYGNNIEVVRGGGRGGGRSYSSGYSSSSRTPSYNYHYHAPRTYAAPSYGGSTYRSTTPPSTAVPTSPGSGAVVAGAVAGTAAVAIAAAQPGSDVRTKQGANVRADPAADGRVVQTLPPNTPVRISEASGNWRKVALSGASPIGWVHRSLLE